MSIRRPIVGVVGSSVEGTPILAEHVGRAVTDRGAILLTGGHATAAGSKAKDVKDAAVDGALAAGRIGQVARVIGILPEMPTPSRKGAKFDLMLTPTSRCLYVHTKLRNHERNVINGMTPDVVIALAGGDGTLSEVAFACYVSIPIIFLNSLATLTALPTGERSRFHTVLTNAASQYPTLNDRPLISAVTGALTALFASPSSLNVVNGATPTDAQQAVNNALTLISPGGTAIRGGRFPGISFDNQSIRDFELCLNVIAD